jgi:hypothetical protein
MDAGIWAFDCAVSLPEVWALVAAYYSGLLGAWRPLGVCKAGACRGEGVSRKPPVAGDMRRVLSH